jgi:hypothetical protein
VNRR